MVSYALFTATRTPVYVV